MLPSRHDGFVEWLEGFRQMCTVKDYLLLLGCNMGDCQEIFSSTLTHLSAKLEIHKISSLYQTSAWGKEDQQDFLNQAIWIRSDLSPGELLSFIASVEKDHQRVREVRWGPRSLDVDILLWGGGLYRSDALEIPHPRMHLRAFTLVPAEEIAGEWQHPTMDLSISEILKACEDDLRVQRLAPER